MRVSEAALALIRRVNSQGEAEYLTQWNDKWQAYSLIGGHREHGESFRDCCIREVEEELGLRPDIDFYVAAEPIGPTCEYTAMSKSAYEMTHYKIDLFATDILTSAALAIIDSNPQNCWCAFADINSNATNGGKFIAAQVGRVLQSYCLDDDEFRHASKRLEEPMTASMKKVEFSGRVREELADALRSRLGDDLRQIFELLEPTRKPESIFVPRIFMGYQPDFDSRIILAVEVTFRDGYERHIVKVGNRDRVEQDFSGWQECTQGRMVASRIFAGVRKSELDHNRVAVVYRDAYSLFGPDEGQITDSQPKLLEEAITWAVLDDKPDPLSAQRAITHVFTDLGLWFYRGATQDNASAWAFYAKHLRINESPPLAAGVVAPLAELATNVANQPTHPPEFTVLNSWLNDSGRGELRRHAAWVLCGRDVPDADPETKPARYLDPVDFVRWAMRDPTGRRLPNSLVGRAHGDLHARNILVGIRRGEVQYPAVFDYGDMGPGNLLAWDFAKLETELKVRLLPAVMNDDKVVAWLVNESKVRQSANAAPTVGLVEVNAQRADRLAAFMAFEELIDRLTQSIQDIRDVERIVPINPPPTGLQKLDRLAGIILRVRQEAAYWLGFKTPKRRLLWKDELYFALAVYGLLNVRWDYSGLEQEAALISSGVALARMPSVRTLLKQSIATGPRKDADYPSYRVPLALCYGDWKSRNYAEGCKFVEEFVLNPNREKRGEQNVMTTIDVRRDVQHAIPLIGQALLLELEGGNLHAVELILEKMRDEARTFHDYETLARIGRLYKDAADRKAEEESTTERDSEDQRKTRRPSLQMYDKSFVVYLEAFELSKDLYVGINAATLALLSGKQEIARKYAEEVASICKDKLDEEKKDRYWLHATEGEAALILNEPAAAFYHSALNELSPGQWGMADSSYKQACRLWKFFGADGERRVGDVLRVFETSDAQPYLTRGFMGRIPTEANE